MFLRYTFRTIGDECKEVSDDANPRGGIPELH
jgi:hypothetical protein